MAGRSEPESSDSLRSFGAVLKTFRKRAGMTQEELSPHVRYSAHFIASIEQGRRLPPPDFVERAEVTLDAFGVLEVSAAHLSRRRGLASWFEHWAQIERDAITLYAYECRIMPGLLQTEAYARAAFQSSLPPLDDDQVERQAAARMQRQSLLTTKPHVDFGFIVEQSLIERCTGGADVTCELIDHLLSCSRLRNVELQIMPTRQEWHAGLDGPLYLAETAQHQWLAYYEGQRSSQLITTPEDASVILQRYGRMRAQALCPKDSASLLERLRGEL